MSRIERFFKIAERAADRTDSKCTFKVGASIAMGSRTIAAGCCSPKSHPKNPKFLKKSKRKQLCAEVSAAFSATRLVSKEKLKKCDVFVARKRKDGTLAMAKPCKYCQDFLKELGITRIFYTDNTGQFQSLYI